MPSPPSTPRRSSPHTRRWKNGQEVYADIKRRAAAAGRNPDEVLVLPGISPYIGSTEAEARALHDEFNALTRPGCSLQLLHNLLGLELSEDDLDGPVPRERSAYTGTTLRDHYGLRRPGNSFLKEAAAPAL